MHKKWVKDSDKEEDTLIKDLTNGDHNKDLIPIKTKDGITIKTKDGTIIILIKDGGSNNLTKAVGVTIQIKGGTIITPIRDGGNNNNPTLIGVKIKADGDNSQILTGDKPKTKGGTMDQQQVGVINHILVTLGGQQILIIGIIHTEWVFLKLISSADAENAAVQE